MSEAIAEQVQESAPLAPVVIDPAAPPTGQESTESASEPPVEKTATEDPPAKVSQRRLDRRIDAANRRAGQEKARADFLAAEIEKLKPKPQPQTGGPKLEEFNDIEAYATAKAEFVAEQRVKEREAKQQEGQAKQYQDRLSSEWETRASDAEEKFEDFNEVVGKLEPTTPLTAALMQLDPSVAYHLGKNPSEATKLAGMHPVQQLVALGRLVQKLESAPTVAKQPSKAPAPITPVTGKAPTTSEDIQPDDDMKTFIRKRARQLGRVK